MSHDPSALPAGLPAPVDDGAADLLPGRVLPDIALPATTGGPVDLRRHGAGKRLVVSAHPRTGRPGVDPPTGWDEIPGARGCTPEACASRDLAAQFATLHVEVFGRSSQDPDHQLEAATRLHLPHASTPRSAPSCGVSTPGGRRTSRSPPTARSACRCRTASSRGTPTGTRPRAVSVSRWT